MCGTENIGLALLFTTIAGLSTGIGSTIAYFIKKPKIVYLSFALGFSAGVMIYLSFMELLPEAMRGAGEIGGIVTFFIGILFIFLIDKLLPEAENPHHVHAPSDIIAVRNDAVLMRTGALTALAIGIHNLPEGLATFTATLSDVKLGLAVTLAIAIHNIPEGISVSMPIFYATGSKKKAFIYSFLSGIAEPLGGFISFLILMPFLSERLLALLLAFVAGIMVYISLDEILPTAHRYGHEHSVISGIIMGLIVMALSLMML